MRKLLVILLVINILTLALGFFMILANSVLYAVIFLALGLLELIPIIAIISNMDDIEELKYQQAKLFYKLKQLEEDISGASDTEIPASVAVTRPENARAAWECVKCGTVNKPNTDSCSHCKAQYSSFVNPTDNPYAKKKISRWVKYK